MDCMRIYYETDTIILLCLNNYGYELVRLYWLISNSIMWLCKVSYVFIIVWSKTTQIIIMWQQSHQFTWLQSRKFHIAEWCNTLEQIKIPMWFQLRIKPGTSSPIIYRANHHQDHQNCIHCIVSVCLFKMLIKCDNY